MPRSALIIGLLALAPFVWGALTMVSDPLVHFTMRHLGPRFAGPYLQLFWGMVVLAFTSGILWGFAAKAPPGVAPTGYLLAVLPAIWGFLFIGGGPVSAGGYLGAGMAGMLAIDRLFWQQGLAPGWWMRARVIFTLVAVVCLLPVVTG